MFYLSNLKHILSKRNYSKYKDFNCRCLIPQDKDQIQKKKITDIALSLLFSSGMLLTLEILKFVCEERVKRGGGRKS